MGSWTSTKRWVYDLTSNQSGNIWTYYIGISGTFLDAVLQTEGSDDCCSWFVLRIHSKQFSYVFMSARVFRTLQILGISLNRLNRPLPSNRRGNWPICLSKRLMSPVDSGIMMGPALGAPLQAINMQIWGFGIDGNNSPGLVLLVVTQQKPWVGRFWWKTGGQSPNFGSGFSAWPRKFLRSVFFMVFFMYLLVMSK